MTSPSENKLWGLYFSKDLFEELSDQKLPFSTPSFRPDLENIHRFSDMALESRHIINNSLLHYPSEVTTIFVVFVQTGNAFFVD